MKLQRDKLQQYQKKITVLTDRETQIARECLRNKQPEKAKLALRRKKYQESLLQKTDQQLAQLEILVNDVEFALSSWIRSTLCEVALTNVRNSTRDCQTTR